MINPVLFAFLLTLFAGLATGIGSLIGLLHKRADARFLAAALGLSAGVMLYVSMVELLPQAAHSIEEAGLGEGGAQWATIGGFFAGIALIAVLDRVVPAPVNPHEAHFDDHHTRDARLLRTGMLTALALALHNFPEGFVTFLAALEAPEIVVPIAVAIAIHNIPEGMAVTVPILEATGSRLRAFGYSFASGLAEPLGALAGYLILRPFLTPTVMGVTMAAIAGIMVFISLDELLPAAEEYGQHHIAIYGLIAGMAVMAISLTLM